MLHSSTVVPQTRVLEPRSTPSMCARSLINPFDIPTSLRARKDNLKRLLPQAPQAQCEHGRQKYKDLYGNPDKKLKKIITRKNSQLKSLTLLPLLIASFLCGYFPDLTRFEPFVNFSVVNGIPIQILIFLTAMLTLSLGCLCSNM